MTTAHELGPGATRALIRQRLRPALRPFRTPVRGHAFAAAPAGVPGPQPGAKGRLAREPHNPADPLAVAVWLDGNPASPWRIGYLDRGVAARVAPRLDDGLVLDVLVDGWVSEPDGRWLRPLVLLIPERNREPDAMAPGGRGQLWGRPPGATRRRVQG